MAGVGLTEEPPEYEEFRFVDIADALAEVRRQHEAGEPLAWTGPDRLHYSIAAGTPPPSWNFSPEGLAHHADQDRDFWDVYTMVAFQLGYHNGVVKDQTNVGRLRRMLDDFMERSDG